VVERGPPLAVPPHVGSQILGLGFPDKPAPGPYHVLLMSLKRFLWFLCLAFAVFFIISAPTDAARLVKSTGESAGDWLSTAAQALSKFLRSLA
jgi:hypothetical protein